MLGTLLESVGKDTASTWLGLIRGPAVIFWFIGALAWWLAHPGVDVVRWLEQGNTATLIALVVITAALLIGSSILLIQVARPLLRLIEGYWPRWLNPVRTRCITSAINRQRNWQMEWSQLEEAGTTQAGTSDPAQTSPHDVADSTRVQQRQAALDQRLHDHPADERKTMPSSVGNILRSSETYPEERYGLDAVVVWPVLWLLLPDATRNALSANRRELDQSVAVLAALCATLIWLPWTWLVLIPALLGPPVVHRVFIVPRARAFAQLVKATFDVHRLTLYANLRFSLPSDPEAEHAAGVALTDYLWRGFPPPGFVFASPPKE